jgi:hypothetical protein
MTTKLNKKDTRKHNLEKHYNLCEQLVKLCGGTMNGKKASLELFKLEKVAHDGATAHCNGEAYLLNEKSFQYRFDFHSDENAWEAFSKAITDKLGKILGSIPEGFFVNGDARGYALKIDSDKKLPLDLHQDWGGYQILSPTIE